MTALSYITPEVASCQSFQHEIICGQCESIEPRKLLGSSDGFDDSWYRS